MQRRSVIKWLVSLTAGACAPAFSLRAATQGASALIPGLDYGAHGGAFGDWFPAADSARVVGRAYLQSIGPSDTWLQYPSQWLASKPWFARVDRPAPDPDLRRDLARRIREDFAGGRTVAVQGWVLSETEAQVCALLYLQAP